jgi:hypothetical protein
VRLAAVVVCLLLAAVPAAWAHGGALEDAVDAFQTAPVYVDPEAEPTLTTAEHQALIDSIGATGKPIYVAVIDPQDDPVHDVVDEFADEVGKDGTYVVVAGGDFGVHSTEFEHERAEEIESQANDADGDLASTLDGVVTKVAAATPAEADGDTPWLWVVVALAAVALVAGGITVWALRRGSARAA